MSPQPLSKLLHTVNWWGMAEFDFTVKAIDHKPEFAAMAMQVIATWSAIDATTLHMAARLVATDVEMVSRMLVAITGSEGRRAAVAAIVTMALKDDEDGLELFTLVKRATNSLRGRRNEYAHDPWAYWSRLPDSLLLFPSGHVATSDAQFEAALRDRVAWLEGDGTEPEPQTPPWYDTTKIMVYRQGDFVRDVRDARKAADLIDQLQVALLSPDSATRARARTELYKEPLIQQALLPQGQKTAP